MTRMVSFRCPENLKNELESIATKFSIDQSTVINQGIRIRIDEINLGILEGPAVRTRRTRTVKPA